MAGEYIKAEGMAGRMGARLMAIVVEGERGRILLYLRQMKYGDHCAFCTTELES